MYASAFDSAVFRDIFSTEPMRRIFSDESRVQYYLDVEAALARVQGRLGVIPAEAAQEICRHCDVAAYDMALLKKQTERIGYPVLPVVQQLVGLCGNGLGEWCHWGATTQDIHRHRDHPADPRRAAAGRAGPARDRGLAR